LQVDRWPGSAHGQGARWRRTREASDRSIDRSMPGPEPRQPRGTAARPIAGAAPGLEKVETLRSTASSVSFGGETVVPISAASSSSSLPDVGPPEDFALEGEAQVAGSPCRDGSGPAEVVLGDAIVVKLRELAAAVARVTPKEQLKAELAKLMAPFVRQVLDTYQCSEWDAVMAISAVLCHSGLTETEALHVEGPRTHRDRPGANGDVVETQSEAHVDETEVEQKDDEEQEGLEIERATRMAKLRPFMAVTKFKSVNIPKASGSGLLGKHIWYPLHAAVKANDIEVVEALLWARADPTMRDSQRLTPLEFGYRLNRSGSHRGVLDALALAMVATPRK